MKVDALSEHSLYAVSEDTQTLTAQQKTFAADCWIGLLIAIGMFSFWVGTLVLLLPLHMSSISLVWLVVAVLGRTFLHTGLFIVAHDAIHANLISQSRWANDMIGRIAIGLYAFLPYERCRTNHWKHHRHPARVGDPDFHDGIRHHPVYWYLKFIGEYLPIYQLIILLSYWCVISFLLRGAFQISPTNFMVFWILPLFLSSIQLFCFGTYLPHRGHHSESTNIHRAQSSQYPVWWSFLTCYHFGYHWEHHEYPKTPWYRLPAVRSSHRSNSV